MATVYQARDSSAAFRAAQRATISVGGKVIPAAAIAQEMQNHEAATPLEAWQAAARALVVREMLLDEARRLGLEPEPREDGDGRRETREEALIRTVTEAEVNTPEPDEATCRRYYEQNLRRFRSADLYEAAHILLPARPDDDAARAAARTFAEALLAALHEKPESFAALAAQHSACPSASVGGSLGQLKRGDIVPELGDALAALQPGRTSRVAVETRYGLHIIRLQRRIDGRQLPFELVAEGIANYLRERSIRLATAQYLAVLALRSEVEGVPLPIPANLGAVHQQVFARAEPGRARVAPSQGAFPLASAARRP